MIGIILKLYSFVNIVIVCGSYRIVDCLKHFHQVTICPQELCLKRCVH